MTRPQIGAWLLVGLLVLGAAYSSRTSGQGTQPPSGAQPAAPAAQPVAQPVAPPESKETAEARAAILANVRAYMEAFNKHDAKAILPLFTENVTITELDGTKVSGLKELEAELKDTFKEEPTTQISVQVDALNFVTPDVATETGRVTYYPDGKTAASEADYAVTHVRTAGKWLMSDVRVFDRTVLSPYDRLRDLEWLVGEWVNESAGSVLHTTYKWDANKAFLLQDFTLKVGDHMALTGTQRIGWDPLSKQIRSWVFDSEGGFGESVWSEVDDRWIIQLKGVRLDGKIVTATNSIERLGKDRFRYQSADRIVGEEAKPNFTAIAVRRPPQPTK
jgi:uncharacterized protein (TIGR02246 family)